MNITVVPSGWGLASPRDVEVLLLDTASHLNRLLRIPFTGVLAVVPAPSHDPTPMTHYRSTQNEPICIQLTARDRRWAQFAYQFAHEFCHVLSDYQRLRGNPNGWFHEAVCELASVFTLRRMAERWQTQPPFSDWAGYSGALASYSEDLLACQERKLPQDTTLSSWISSEEESLRASRYQREKNAVVADALLPIFEMHPEGWNAIRSLPDSGAVIKDYLQKWAECVEPVDSQFVNLIIEALGGQT